MLKTEEKKKHRLVVEVTTSSTLSESDLIWWLKEFFKENLDLGKRPVKPSRYSVRGTDTYLEKLQLKSFSRVVKGLKPKGKRQK